MQAFLQLHLLQAESLIKLKLTLEIQVSGNGNKWQGCRICRPIREKELWVFLKFVHMKEKWC